MIDKKGCTPLIHAIKKNNLPATQTLLDQGADVSIQDLQGNDALRYAVISKTSVDIIRLLINKGANVNLPDSERITPLILADKCDNAEGFCRICFRVLCFATELKILGKLCCH